MSRCWLMPLLYAPTNVTKRLVFAFTPGQCLADGVQQRPQDNHDGGLRAFERHGVSYTRKPKM